MVTTLRAEEEAFEGAELGGFELPPDFRMPTTEEIEWDLALGNPGWSGLLRTPQDQPATATMSVEVLTMSEAARLTRTT